MSSLHIAKLEGPITILFTLEKKCICATFIYGIKSDTYPITLKAFAVCTVMSLFIQLSPYWRETCIIILHQKTLDTVNPDENNGWKLWDYKRRLCHWSKSLHYPTSPGPTTHPNRLLSVQMLHKRPSLKVVLLFLLASLVLLWSCGNTISSHCWKTSKSIHRRWHSLLLL